MDSIYPHTYYGDNVRWFIGKVEDNIDPMKLGRVRVRIHGLHDYQQDFIETSELPWAQVGIPTTEGGISGIGKVTGLQRGATVYGIFLDGEMAQLPLVLASIPITELPTEIQKETINHSEIYASLEPNIPEGTGSTGMRNTPGPNLEEAYGISGKSNPEKAFNYFIEYGFTPEQAAGIVGNLMQESGPTMNPKVKSAGSEKSYGIAQWNSSAVAGNRLGLLKEFATDIGKPWDDLETQLRFITWELENFSYLGLSKLRKTRTIEEAVIVFEQKYERPSEPARSFRIKYAKDVYKRFNQ